LLFHRPLEHAPPGNHATTVHGPNGRNRLRSTRRRASLSGRRRYLCPR
jgi:hypothetical protein